MVKQSIAAAALLLLGAVGARAQIPAGRITGVVHVAGPHQHEDTTITHESVVGATVRVLETQYSAQTDDRGQFALPMLPPGQYLLEARRIGYQPARQVIRVEPGRALNLALHMTPAPITVDAITVEALVDQGQRTYDLSSLIKVAPVGTANVTTVTLRDIERVHARDPWDLVREATGLEVHEQGQGPGFASDAVIRGFTSDHSTDVALVVDGVPINEPINGHGEGYADWNLFFPAALADVQVIKGPISPLFGNFSGSGAVNVTTQASTRETSFQAEGGSHTFGAGTFTTGFERGAWGGFFGAHGVHSNGWRLNSGYDAAQVVARANRRVSPELLLDAGAQYYGTRWDSPGYLSLAQFDAGDLTSAADLTDGGDKSRFQGRLSAVLTRSTFQWQSTLWGYQSRWHLFLNIPELGGAGEGLGQQTEEIDHRHAFGGRSIARWTMGTLEFTAGAEAQTHTANYNIWATVLRARDRTVNRFDATFLNAAGLLGASKNFGRALRLESALRADLLQPKTTNLVTRLPLAAESHAVLSPKFGAVWYARGDLQFYGSAARGFRSAPGTIGDPTKEPVTVWAFEGGARVSVKRFDASAAVFRLDTRNEMVFNPITLETEETGHSIREGIETELRLRPIPELEFETHWTLNTRGVYFLRDTAGAPAASLARPLFHLSGATAAAAIMHDEGNSGPVPGVADYSGRAGVVVHPTPAVGLHGWVTIMGPYVPLGEPEAKTDAFAIANLQASVRLNDRIELTFGLDNILNTRAPELRASGAVNPVAPRTVHVNIHTRW
ncbi:MAG: TonB-dependent receptor [Gemmatimonadetes bacterium]|nr:TonB-dependent receptor [Gemmatimonadota bacterium]